MVHDRVPAPAVDADRRASASNDVVPEVFYDLMGQTGILGAGANVIMQLAMLPIGHGVARSRVESGRVDRHPIKRLRTTLTYIAVALYGTEADRVAMRRAVTGVHRQVHAVEGDPVAYDALDRNLQLWVAACLYKGLEDIHVALFGRLPEGERADNLYRHGARLGTTLQVRPEQWPADRDAFETYWRANVEAIEMDDVTRPYLQGIAQGRFLGRPWSTMARPLLELVSVGFLPPEFRAELGLPWDDRRQRVFDAVVAVSAGVDRLTPLAIRRLPFDGYLRYYRRLVRKGRSPV